MIVMLSITRSAIASSDNYNTVLRLVYCSYAEIPPPFNQHNVQILQKKYDETILKFDSLKEYCSVYLSA